MNRALFYSAIVVSFVSFYALGLYATRGSSEYQGAEPAPTKQQINAIRASQTAAEAGATSVPKKSASEAVKEESGAELFDTLFGGSNGLASYPEMQQAIESRFNTPYPAGERERAQEVISRMGILKAMDRDYRASLSKPEQAQIFSFYSGIAMSEDEPFSVRRQAHRNLLPWVAKLEEQDRMKVFAQSQRHLATAGKSEAEILEEIFHHGN